MKIYIIIIFSCFAQCCFGQNKIWTTSTKLVADSNFEVAATFPDGEENFKKYVAKNIRLPEIENKISGEIHMSFTIGVDGFLTDIKLTKNTLGKLGEEIAIDAIRVLSLCPKWNPATKGNKPIKMTSMIPLKITNE